MYIEINNIMVFYPLKYHMSYNLISIRFNLLNWKTALHVIILVNLSHLKYSN